MHLVDVVLGQGRDVLGGVGVGGDESVRGHGLHLLQSIQVGRQTFRAQGVLHGGQRGGHGVVKIVDEGEIVVRRGDQIQRIGILQKSRRALGMGRREAQFCQL